MNITRAMKEERLAETRDLVAKQQAIIFVKYLGLSAIDVDTARRDIEASGAKYLVTKNTLLRIALTDSNLPTEIEAITQPIATVFALEDQVATAKAIVKANKTFEGLQILGGIIDGELVDEATIRTLATLPGRQELLAKLVGSVAAPLSGLVSVLSGNLRGLVSVLHQYEQKKA